MPQLGLGTWRMSGRDCQDAVESALALGYRHIDTGQMYANEAEVGAGIAASGVHARRTAHDHQGVERKSRAGPAARGDGRPAWRSCASDYVDLYLIHWPSPHMNLPAALETMMALQQEGNARKIGVANFNVALLRQAIEQMRRADRGGAVRVSRHCAPTARCCDYVRRHGCPSWPIRRSRKGQLAKHPVLTKIAEKHGATPSQIAIAWLLDQPDVAPIPKSVHRERQQENLAAFDIRLDADDRAAIEALPKDQRCVNPGFAPAWDATG